MLFHNGLFLINNQLSLHGNSGIYIMKKKIKNPGKTDDKLASGFLIPVPAKSDIKDAFLAAGNENLPPPVKLSVLNQITANIKAQTGTETDAIDKMIEAESADEMQPGDISKEMSDARINSMLDTDAVDPDKKSLAEMDEDFRE